MNINLLKQFILKTADDQLILGHRNSEWTGMGPLLEEDIAFSSMAQDKVGHSYALYNLLHDLGEAPPDTLAFMRPVNQFRNCIFVELPNGDYDFSLIRHFLFNTAEAIRFDALTECSYEPLAQIARKIRGELRYHTLHANSWINRLGCATDESISRLQRSLDIAMPYALGMFETVPEENDLIAEGISSGEAFVRQNWMNKIQVVIDNTRLCLPAWDSVAPVLGGRLGNHSEYLSPLLEEMGEVFRIDPEAQW